MKMSSYSYVCPTFQKINATDATSAGRDCHYEFLDK